MTDRSISVSRRRFLFAAGAGGVGAALAAKVGSTPPAPPRRSAGSSRRGYRLTAHIGKYYRSAKF